MSLDLSRALDPSSIMRECGLEPDDWQRELLTHLPHRALLNIARQCGKSSTASVLALHQSLYQPGSLVLLLSPSLRQSSELFRKCISFYRQLADAEPIIAESALRVELGNGSRIVSLPSNESNVRGYSAAALVVIDEAARCADELVSAVRPMLAVSHGKLLMMSTPWGSRGVFWKEWTQGGPGWERFTLTAYECSRIDRGFLEEEQRSLGSLLFDQEYLCRFVDADSSVFDSAIIEQAISDEVRPLFS